MKFILKKELKISFENEIYNYNKFICYDMYFLLIFRMAPCKMTTKRVRGEASGTTSAQGRQPQILGPTNKKMYAKFE